jgi:carbonic anhydrase/SulP family sulfate permease
MFTGFKLASPSIFRKMWSEGSNQFLPFVTTVIAIIATDLLVGIGIGLIAAIGFILRSNLTRPVRQIVEQHAGNEVLRMVLPNQITFLNRAALMSAMQIIPTGSHVELDASNTDYIDPDILDLITDFEQ